ncbi:MAG: ComEC/Rec2 family competence protein [Oligoflexia bacterium]|nr:ComEC/Rec2 family competence protein [Oligoflexia bacterium]
MFAGKVNRCIILFFALVLSYALYFGKAPEQKQYKKCHIKPGSPFHVLTESRYFDIYSKLILGCRGGRSGTDNTKYFYNTGTGHLLSISGLHIGGIILLVFLLINTLAVFILKYIDREYFPRIYISAPLSLAAAGIYICFTGFEIPRVRAFLTASMMILCIVIPVLRSSYTRLITAAAVILLLFPSALYSYSFYFSFISVAAVLLSRKKNLLCVSTSVFVFLLPLNLYLNSSINFFDIISNAVLIPVFCTVYFPIIVFTSILLACGAGSVTVLMDHVTHFFVLFAKMLSGISVTTKIHTLAPNIYEVFLLYLLIIIYYKVIIYGKHPCRKTAIYLYSGAAVLSTVLPLYHVLMYGDTNYMVVYNIRKARRINGSGDTILLRNRKSTMLIDTGFGGFSTRETITKLLRRKIKSIDYLVITHEDLDHSGGIREFLSTPQINIKNIITSNRTYSWMKKSNIKIDAPLKLACKNSVLDAGVETLTFIHPLCNHKQYLKSNNHNALSFYRESASGRLCFFSDLPGPVLKSFPASLKKQLSGCDITQMAHHCALRDNPPEFFNSIKPVTGFCTRSSQARGKFLDQKKFLFPVLMSKDHGDMFFNCEPRRVEYIILDRGCRLNQ